MIIIGIMRSPFIFVFADKHNDTQDTVGTPRPHSLAYNFVFVISAVCTLLSAIGYMFSWAFKDFLIRILLVLCFLFAYVFHANVHHLCNIWHNRDRLERCTIPNRP